MSVHAEEIRAIRLIKIAMGEGYLVSLYPEDDLSDPLHKDSLDYATVNQDVHACEMMTVVIRKVEGRRTVGATFLLVFGNGDDGPIANHTDNELGNRLFNAVMGPRPLD